MLPFIQLSATNFLLCSHTTSQLVGKQFFRGTFLNSFSISILRNFNIFLLSYSLDWSTDYIFFFGNSEWVNLRLLPALCPHQLSAICSWWNIALPCYWLLPFANTPLNLFAWTFVPDHYSHYMINFSTNVTLFCVKTKLQELWKYSKF